MHDPQTKINGQYLKKTGTRFLRASEIFSFLRAMNKALHVSKVHNKQEGKKKTLLDIFALQKPICVLSSIDGKV